MRAVHRTTAIVAALGIAFGVTACGDADESSAPVKQAPKVTATATMPTPPVGVSQPATNKTVAQGVDSSLKSDLKWMATLQETYIVDHVTSGGVAVTATKPGGTVTVASPNDFHASPGNVIAVVKSVNLNYCISGYNEAATKATSTTSSFVYKSDKGGLQASVGTC